MSLSLYGATWVIQQVKKIHMAEPISPTDHWRAGPRMSSWCACMDYKMLLNRRCWEKSKEKLICNTITPRDSRTFYKSKEKVGSSRTLPAPRTHMPGHVLTCRLTDSHPKSTALEMDHFWAKWSPRNRVGAKVTLHCQLLHLPWPAWFHSLFLWHVLGCERWLFFKSKHSLHVVVEISSG